MATARMKELFRKYGRTAVGVHLGVYATSLAGIYAAIKNNVDVEHLLIKYGLLKEHEMEDEQAAEPSWFRKTLHSGGSAFLIAFICNKATFPIRAPITVGLTPIVARFVRQHYGIKQGVKL